MGSPKDKIEFKQLYIQHIHIMDLEIIRKDIYETTYKR